MQCLNTRYGLYYNKKYKRIGYVFRDRYKAEEYECSNYKKINFTNTKEYRFIDIEENKRVVCNKLVKEFLKVKELKLEELKGNKTELGELVKILKNIRFHLELFLILLK